MDVCSRCRVGRWAELRKTMGLTQRQFAELVGVAEITVRRLEYSTQHRCLRRASLLLLRSWLQSPEYRSRLLAAGYPHPWPEDLIELSLAEVGMGCAS